MIDNGYLFAEDNTRLFVNTCLGCQGECSYCYLPQMGYSNKNFDEVMRAEKIIEFLEASDYELSDKTLITIGCFSECLDERNKPETLKLIAHFLSRGNQVQLSTKRQVSYSDIASIIPLIKYYGQFVIFVSSSTISEHDILEKNTETIENRFASFELIEYDIPIVLYMKPVLKNITIKDLSLYKMYIRKYKINYVVVGSLFTTEMSSLTVPFSNKNELFYSPVHDEDKITNDLRKECHVFSKSTQIMSYFNSEKRKVISCNGFTKTYH